MRLAHKQAGPAQATFLITQCPVYDAADIVLVQGAQYIHPGARQQGIVQFERGIFRGGADKNHRAVFHKRQESILLGFVKAVHFIHKQYGAFGGHGPHLFGLFHRLANIFNPGQYSGQTDKLGVGLIGDHFRQCGFAGTRWSPKHHGMQPAAFYGLAQRFAGRNQMLLAGKFFQRAGTHSVGQRSAGYIVGYGE